MKTVAIDLTSLDDNFSGIEHYALYITKEIIKRKEFSFFLLFKNKISFFSKDELAGSNIHVILIKKNKISTILFWIPQLINKISPDIALFLAFPPSLFWKPKKNTAVYATVHDMVAFDCPETMPLKSRLFFRLSIKHALKIASYIITISNFSRRRIETIFSFDKQRIIVAYCSSAMDSKIEDFYYLKKRYNIPNKYLLALSTIEPRKNFKQLLIWLDQVWLANGNIPDLVVAGRKGWKTDDILDCVSKENKFKIHFIGFVDDKDVASLYHYAKTFIFPSIYEGFGIPVIEAIKSGQLPLCSDIPTSKEILGDDYPFFFSLDGSNFRASLQSALNVKTNEANILLEKEQSSIQKFSWLISAKTIFEKWF